MPIIKDMPETTKNSFPDWRNPNLILRNTIRVKSSEFALFKFVNDLLEGDKSKFHPIKKLNEINGKQFTDYVYCSVGNIVGVDDNKQQIVPGKCEYCLSADPEFTRTSPRYGYWVFCYYIFHATQNPNLGRYDDAQEYESYTLGQRKMFRETIMKPQLLVISHPTFEQLDAKSARFGTILNTLYEYSSISANGKINYQVERSDLEVPDIDDEIAASTRNLPELDQVRADLIKEFEFQTVNLPGDDTLSKDEIAFAAAVAPVETPKKVKK